MLFKAGLQVPVILLLLFVGNALNDVPLHTEATGVNAGGVTGFTEIEAVSFVEHPQELVTVNT